MTLNTGIVTDKNKLLNIDTLWSQIYNKNRVNLKKPESGGKDSDRDKSSLRGMVIVRHLISLIDSTLFLAWMIWIIYE